MKHLAAEAEELEQYIIEQRRYLHRYPELSFEEKETTAYIGRELEQMGLEPHYFDNYYGVWTSIEGPVQGKTILLRADMDALPITEATGLPFTSENPGVMHACGHDAHIAMLLAGTRLLLQHQQELKGRVKILFQSAEESSFGARYYVKNGFLDDVDVIYGAHVWGTLEAPYISVQAGPRMASCDNFTIRVHGKAAHGSAPQEGIDAILAASAIVLQLQSLVARRAKPGEALVITVGQMQGGTRSNIIADEVVMKGTVRSHCTEERVKVEGWMRDVIENTAKAYGATAELIYEPMTGVLMNDSGLSAIAQRTAEKLYGQNATRPFAPLMSSEDFATYLETVPGIFAFVGSRNESAGIDAPHHNDHFTVEESALKRGAAMYAGFAMNYLEETYNSN